MRDFGSEPPTVEERRAAIERICSSNELKRAARLREFLHYVGERSLEGDNVLVSESEIGVRVFNRPENYDTSSDNIVRVNASELRKRIAAYYASEGSEERILVEIPRGSYLPQFRLRSASSTTANDEPLPATQPDPNQTPPISSPETASLRLKILRYAAFAIAVLLAFACIDLAHQNHVQQERLSPWKSEPILGPFWTSILRSPRDTDIVLADISVATVEFILKQHLNLSGYLNHAYDEQIQASNLSPDLKSDLEDLTARRNGSVSDFRVAQKILDLYPNSPNVRLQYAREYRPRSATAHNLILIGSSVSNPWTSLFDDQLNFVITYDSTLRQMVVQNRRPPANESAVYAVPTNNNNIAFSIIDFLPNQNHSANVLIIAGTNSVATEAAGDFLTSEDSMHHLAELLHSRTMPYFELLLKTTRLQGAPIAADILAYRTLPGGPASAQ